MLEKKISERLTDFLGQCELHQKYHLGYPYNLNCNQYSNLAPFLNFFINNLGDSFVESNYKIDSRQFEHEVLDFFASLWKINKGDYDFIFGSRYEHNSGSDDDTIITKIGNYIFTKI